MPGCKISLRVALNFSIFITIIYIHLTCHSLQLHVFKLFLHATTSFVFTRSCEVVYLDIFHSVIQFSSIAQLCVTLCHSWTTAGQASLQTMPSSHLILSQPLLPPSIFPASGSFPMSQFFALCGQNIRLSVSSSVLQINIQN